MLDAVLLGLPRDVIGWALATSHAVRCLLLARLLQLRVEPHHIHDLQPRLQTRVPEDNLWKVSRTSNVTVCSFTETADCVVTSDVTVRSDPCFVYDSALIE